MNHELSYTCPLAAVDRRLDDVHEQWHQAEQTYFDPEAFRLAVQSAIATLRTVSFVLQSHKHKIPDFDAWYQKWREKLGADSLMRWMVDARNRIEKQGDLETHSFVRAEIIASYLDEGPRVEVPAQLFERPWELVKNIPEGAAGDHVRKNGTLRIERRWVENTLPDYELLEAVAIAYGRISELVHDAHRQMGLKCPVTTDVETGDRYENGAREGRLPCMIGHEHPRALKINLSDGVPVQLRTERMPIDERSRKAAKERYGDLHKGMFGPPDAPEEEKMARLFETARSVFLRDGYHQPIFFLFRDRRLVRMINTPVEDTAQKYVVMRAVADEVTTHGADAVIFLTEVWVAPVESVKPYERAADSPARREALTASLVTRSGTAIELMAMIERDGSGLTLGATEINRSPVLMFFAPVYKAWKQEVPPAWVEAGMRHASGESE